MDSRNRATAEKGVWESGAFWRQFPEDLLDTFGNVTDPFGTPDNLDEGFPGVPEDFLDNLENVMDPFGNVKDILDGFGNFSGDFDDILDGEG
jgi:hypothetical protein